ncbi:MAG: hypothetical protein K0Q57_121 [Gammaproteobacteria bacterium]|jgi:UDP-MurNAc hydroxylase|nr:hypothetical protein [Gammaproteobacteria bacterium]
MKVRYIYSACVVIESPDVSILCDPWFTDGIYDGSWYQYPKLANPIEVIGKVNLIYISHIHPDHYDPDFIKAYLTKYPDTKVIIANFKHNFLSRKMSGDGIPHQAIEKMAINETQLYIVPNDNNDMNNVDSALSVRFKEQSVVNMNDNAFSQNQIDALLTFGGHPQIALLSYTGAGPYPQTYYPISPELEQKALAKKLDFFERYKRMRDALKPKKTIPFAGKYILGGALHYLNPYRGIADAVEVTEFDSNAVILADGGQAYIDTHSLKANAIRQQPYSCLEMQAYAASLAHKPMLYETYFHNLPVAKLSLPIKRLLAKAYPNATHKSSCEENYYYCFKLADTYAVLNANKANPQFSFEQDISQYTPRSEITIDPHYLYGLLTCVFHWNNAEVGSQYFIHRSPDIFNRKAQNFLNFLHI